MVSKRGDFYEDSPVGGRIALPERDHPSWQGVLLDVLMQAQDVETGAKFGERNQPRDQEVVYRVRGLSHEQELLLRNTLNAAVVTKDQVPGVERIEVQLKIRDYNRDVTDADPYGIVRLAHGRPGRLTIIFT